MKPETYTPPKTNKFTRLARAIGGGVKKFAEVISTTPTQRDLGNPLILERKEDAALRNMGDTEAGATVVDQHVATDPKIVEGLQEGGLIGRDFSGLPPHSPLGEFEPPQK